MIATESEPGAEPVVIPEFDDPAPEAPIRYGGSPGGSPGTLSKGSRWNAVRHGCMAKELFPADLQAEIDRCTAMLTELHRPTNAFEVDTVARMGRAWAQLNRVQRSIVVNHQRTMDRSILCWTEDREIYIDGLVKRLDRDPGIARALARSKQGVTWLLQTWNGLRDMLKITGKWSDDQVRLALNLMGVRPELRDGYLIDFASGTTAELIDIVDMEVSRLSERLDRSLNALDWADRMMAAAGMPTEEDADTKRLRKQEAKVKLDYRRAKAELMEARALAAAAAANPAPTPAPEPAPVATRHAVADKPSDPPPRPETNRAAANFLHRQFALKTFEVPATASAAAKTMAVQLPYPGGDPEPEAGLDSDVESDPVSLPDPAPASPETASVPASASRAETSTQRLEKDRLRRRALERKARKAARRRRR